MRFDLSRLRREHPDAQKFWIRSPSLTLMTRVEFSPQPDARPEPIPEELSTLTERVYLFLDNRAA